MENVQGKERRVSSDKEIRSVDKAILVGMLVALSATIASCTIKDLQVLLTGDLNKFRTSEVSEEPIIKYGTKIGERISSGNPHAP